ncbi:AP-3 complex subunit beta-1-like [Penaeus indicus]|uniref:AP-3 complex subunit beta-1-like n=1 Tax=Penaeus indicus TaxID=29960 RepID=UPI00300BFA81
MPTGNLEDNLHRFKQKAKGFTIGGQEVRDPKSGPPPSHKLVINNKHFLQSGKTTKIQPIIKCDEKRYTENYCPISLLSAFIEILEKKDIVHRLQIFHEDINQSEKAALALSQCHFVQSFVASRARMAALFQVLAMALLFAYAFSQLYREPELWQDDYVSEISDQSDTDVPDDPDFLALLAAEDEEDEDDSEDEDDDPLEHFVDVLRKLKQEEGIDEDVIPLLLSEPEGEDEDKEHASEAESGEEQVARELRREKRSPARGSSSRSSSSRSSSSSSSFSRSRSSISSIRSSFSGRSRSRSTISSIGSSSRPSTSSTGGVSNGWNTGTSGTNPTRTNPVSGGTRPFRYPGSTGFSTGYGYRGYPAAGFGHGRGGGFHGMGGLAVGKTAKTLLGAYMKMKIAKYALKFGAEAAKAYFQYKLREEMREEDRDKEELEEEDESRHVPPALRFVARGRANLAALPPPPKGEPLPGSRRREGACYEWLSGSL